MSNESRAEGGPAFARAGVASECRWEDRPEEGMTLKDYFAGQALAGLMANPAVMDADTTGFLMGDATNLYARMAYRMAAAMVRERLARRERGAKLEATIAKLRGEGDLTAAPRQGSEMSEPLNMVLPCPKCGTIHIDAPEPAKGWENPPHKSHLCHGCGTIWRPADVPTNGVAAVQTRGKADTWPEGAA